MPEEESPSSFLDIDFTSDSVDLLLIGSWKFSLTGGLAYDFFDGKSIPISMTGLEHDFNFQQVPDITLSLWILDQYFFETSLLDGGDEIIDFNTYLFGYNGLDGDLLQRIRVGNSEVNTGVYSHLAFPDSAKNSLGISTLLQTDNTIHDFMLRYESKDRVSFEYMGLNEINETILPVHSHCRNRFFRLPDTAVSELRVFQEDTDGDFTGSDSVRYRELPKTSYYFDNTSGSLAMKETFSGRICVYYTKDGVEIGDSSIGKKALVAVTGNHLDSEQVFMDFYWNQNYFGTTFSSGNRITIDSADCLLVSEYPQFNPFEDMRYYSYPVSSVEYWRTEVALYNKNGSQVQNYGYGQSADGDYLRISNGYTDSRKWYPFIRDFPELYGSMMYTEGNNSPYQLSIISRTKVDNITIEGNFIPGSVVVTVNGVREYNYTIEDNTVRFLTPVHDHDLIVVSYQVNSSSYSGGDLLVGIGNRFQLTEDLILDVGAGLQWNVFSGSYSKRSDEKTGSVLLAAGIDWEQDDFSLKFDGGLSFSSGDTTGILRAFGMESDSFSLTASRKTSYPAAGGTGLLLSDYIVPVYRDYHSYSASGISSVMEFDWMVNGSAPVPLPDIPGPYIVRAVSKNFDQTFAVVEAELGSGQWSGSQIIIPSSDSPLDLSSFSSFSFYLQEFDAFENCDLFLEIGLLSEDLDGDSILDSESSPLSSGFIYNSGAKEYRIGSRYDLTQDGYADSEDINGDGILNTTEQVVRIPLDNPGDTWKKVEIVLSGEQQNKLSQVSGIRLIIENATPGTVTGRIAISGIECAGSSFIKSNSGSIQTIRQIEEFHAASIPASTLTDSYPEVESVFHPDDEVQKILEWNWSGATSGNPPEITGFMTPMGIESYEELTFYYALPSSSSSGELLIELSGVNDSGGPGTAALVSVPVEKGSTWNFCSINLTEKKVRINGEEKIPEVFTVYPDQQYISQITLQMNGTPAGILLLDEICFQSPKLYVSGGGEIMFMYSLPDPVTLGKFPLIGRLSISQFGSLYAPMYAQGFLDAPAAANGRTRTELSMIFAYTGIDLGFTFDWLYPLIILSGDHALRFPASGPFVVTDTYSERNEEGTKSFTRGNTATLSVSPVLFTLSSATTGVEGNLFQSWGGHFNVSYSPLVFTADGAMQYNYSGIHLPYTDYFSNWILGYQYLSPYDMSFDPERILHLQFDTGISIPLDSGTIGLRIDPEIGYRNTGFDTRIQNNDYGAALTVPISFTTQSAGTWSVDSTYSRNYNGTLPSGTREGISKDFDRLGESFNSQEFMWSSIPFYEFWDNELAETVIALSGQHSASEYTAAYQLDVKRSYGSNWYDLLVPSQLSFSMDRKLELIQSSFEDSFTWSVSSRSTALNLFGAQGAYSFLDFFVSDEYTTVISYTRTDDSSGDLIESTLSLQNYLTFFGDGMDRFSIENTFQYQFADLSLDENCSVLFVWNNALSEPITVPFFSEEEVSITFQHTESLSFFSKPLVNRENSTGFILGHETKAVFEGIGNIAAFIDIAYTWEPDNLGEIHHLFGFDLGLVITFAF